MEFDEKNQKILDIKNGVDEVQKACVELVKAKAKELGMGPRSEWVFFQRVANVLWVNANPHVFHAMNEKLKHEQGIYEDTPDV